MARGRAIIPANKRHTELEPTVVGEPILSMTRPVHVRWQLISLACGCM